MWRMEGADHDFSVSVVWQAIRETDNVVDWFKVVWFTQAIPRHSFIVWLIMGGYLKTQDRLKSYEINPQVIQLCSLCSQVMDSHCHIFFECNFSTQVWTAVCGFTKMSLVQPVWSDIIDYQKSNSHRYLAWNIIGKILLGVLRISYGMRGIFGYSRRV